MSPDITPSVMLLDDNVSPMKSKQKLQLTSNFNYLPSTVKFDCNV